MNAETLRRAASLMRERARGTSRPGRWDFLLAEHAEGDLSGLVRSGDDASRYTVAYCDYSNDAEYIASWHPAVALVVADWLNRVGDDTEADNFEPDEFDSALKVARAYLGDDQ